MTAAPGPQQPDEVPYSQRRWCSHCGAWGAHPTDDHPAAPSAQPNEEGARIHHAIPDDHPVWQALLNSRVTFTVPAQPVRDTGERRR